VHGIVATGGVLIIFLYGINNWFMQTVIGLARAGSTETFKELAKLEGVSPEKFRDRVARGQIVVMRNVKRPPRRVTVIGRGVSTKINVNLGTSGEVVDLDAELKRWLWRIGGATRLWTSAWVATWTP
jgi:thiamine biosynthesis protein ThiC